MAVIGGKYHTVTIGYYKGIVITIQCLVIYNRWEFIILQVWTIYMLHIITIYPLVEWSVPIIGIILAYNI